MLTFIPKRLPFVHHSPHKPTLFYYYPFFCLLPPSFHFLIIANQASNFAHSDGEIKVVNTIGSSGTSGPLYDRLVESSPNVPLSPLASPVSSLANSANVPRGSSFTAPHKSRSGPLAEAAELAKRRAQSDTVAPRFAPPLRTPPPSPPRAQSPVPNDDDINNNNDNDALNSITSYPSYGSTVMTPPLRTPPPSPPQTRKTSPRNSSELGISSDTDISSQPPSLAASATDVVVDDPLVTPPKGYLSSLISAEMTIRYDYYYCYIIICYYYWNDFYIVLLIIPLLGPEVTPQLHPCAPLLDPLKTAMTNIHRLLLVPHFYYNSSSNTTKTGIATVTMSITTTTAMTLMKMAVCLIIIIIITKIIIVIIIIVMIIIIIIIIIIQICLFFLTIIIIIAIIF